MLIPCLSEEQQIYTQPLPAAYTTDWTGKFHSKGSAVLFPTSHSQLSQILAHCSTHSLPICIQSGKTSLVGGSVPAHCHEIILSLMHLPKEITISDNSSTVTATANCTLAELNAALSPLGRCIPIDLPAVESICTIGGCVATNAGGQRRILWGTVHDNLVGLEVMLPSGSTLALGQLEGERKVSCGFDLLHLMVGSEGTLAVTTKVCFKTVPILKAEETCVQFQAFASFGECLEAMVALKRQKNGSICLLEMWDSECMTAVEGKECCKENDKFFLLSQVLESSASTTNLDHSARLKTRSRISTSISALGPTLKYDLAFNPSQDYYTPIVQGLREAFPRVRVFGYGHFGEGNLHLNVVLPEPGFGGELEGLIGAWVFERVLQLGGCPASEHGLGQAKAKIWKERFACPLRLRLMEGVKGAFDSQGLLNRGKIFDK